MILAIFFISHILAAYIFRTKNKLFSLHAGIYSIIFFFTYLLLFHISFVWKSFFLIICFHAAIDFLKEKLETKFSLKNPRFSFFSFCIDQILHIFILILTFHYFHLERYTNHFFLNLQNTHSFQNIIVYSLIFLIILTPSSIFIQKIFLLLSLKIEENLETKAGNMIGKLERILIVTLLLQHQYEAIGFVLTAKSIARFRQLDDKEFAEKYLVGTLTSVLLALGASLLTNVF